MMAKSVAEYINNYMTIEQMKTNYIKNLKWRYMAQGLTGGLMSMKVIKILCCDICNHQISTQSNTYM